MQYYSAVGSYDGAVKFRGKWVRVHDLNRIDKTGWNRHQGPPTPAMALAMRLQPSFPADVLFPHLRVKK